jgi:hypothetical protein
MVEEGIRMKKRRFREAKRDGMVFQRSAEYGCPACGKKLNTLGIPGEEKTPLPSEGDVSICIGCGQVLMFDAFLNLAIADPTKVLMMRLQDADFSAQLDRLQSAHRQAFPRH